VALMLCGRLSARSTADRPIRLPARWICF
jgi:hypothetical protein